jgi:flagellar hook-associated protein 1 FlgK
MSNILDISRSGLMAYRNALAVTAENIANVGTDGYRRRDVSTITAGGGQSTATTLPTGGQGVKLADVRRAFDDLAAERARSASANQAAASAHLDGARAIETLMIRGDDGIDGTIRGFFDSLSRLAGNPTDLVTRALALSSGEAMTSAVSELGRGLAGLRNDLLNEAGGAASEAQGFLEELAQVSRRMGGLSVPGSPAAAAMHPLSDRRDALLADLARVLPVSVTLAEDGRPTVRFGSAAGPVLLDGMQSARLTVSAVDHLTLHIDAPDGTARETRLLPSGQIGGLSRAMGALDMASAELDAFARVLTDTLNPVHRGGIDLKGVSGTDLFHTQGWQALPAAANGGTLQTQITPTAITGPRAAMELVFDRPAGLWRAFDTSGTEIAASADRLILPGVTLDLAGTAADGDRITLRPVTGRAMDLGMAITDPAQLAAASAFAATASPENGGAGRLSATMIGLPAAALAPLGPNLGTEAIDLTPGVIGLIPAGSGAVTLSSLGRSAATTLQALPGATRLDLTVSGQADGFDVTGLADASAIAAALNGGTPLSDGGRTLASLGLVAAAFPDGSLVLSRPGSGAPVAASLSGPGGTVTGQTTAAEAAGGVMQIITRNGRHIAGTPLSAAEAAALMTPTNGFLDGAVYDPTPLTAVSGPGYRGTDIDRMDLPGLQSARLAAGGLVTGPGLPLPAEPARSLALEDAFGATTQINLPDGASAALIAGRLTGAMPGLSATASTALELSGFAAGAISFALTGRNAAPLQVSAVLSNADAAPLAQAVNALTGATGLRAEVSPDGARLLLVQVEGHDIALSGLSGPAQTGVQIRPALADGRITGAGGAWASGTAIRQGGQVFLTSVQEFGLTEGMTTTGSTPASGGDFALQTSQAGAAASLTFRDVPLTAEGGLLHRISLGGQDFEAALPPGTPATTIAATLAGVMRSGAPDAVLTGQPLAQLPPDGSAMTLRMDGAAYSLRMQGGQPVISGPEPGRLTARFDSANRLVVEARGVTDGTGIGLAPSAAFGFAPGAGVLTLTGQPPDPAALPATLVVDLSGTPHALTLGPGGALTVPPGFPGNASVDPATGALRLDLAAPAAGLRITPSSAVGFGGPGVALRVEGAALRLLGDGAPLALRADVSGSLGQSLSLRDLPPEDLIMAFTGSGTLRLAGALDPAAGARAPGALTLEIVDAMSGQVALNDATTGHRVADGTLDSTGRVMIAGLSLQLTGQPATGDRFGILPAAAGSSNADTALALAALRNPDPVTGNSGVTERFTRLQGDTGLRAAAAARSLATATAAAEAADREQAAIGAVDLDREAARLLELQQGYQASAQAVSIARDLFDTLLKMF